MDKYLLITVFHLVVVVPLFLFVGFSRAATPDWVYNVLLAMGIIVGAYHGFKALGRLLAKSQYAYVNLIHVLVVAPLILWIGYYGKRTGRAAYDCCSWCRLLRWDFTSIG